MENDSKDVVCDCLPEFHGSHCEEYSGFHSHPGSSSTTAIFVPILVIILVAAAAGSWYFIRKKPL